MTIEEELVNTKQKEFLWMEFPESSPETSRTSRPFVWETPQGLQNIRGTDANICRINGTCLLDSRNPELFTAQALVGLFSTLLPARHLEARLPNPTYGCSSF